MGHDVKQSESSYDWNSHILSHGKTCKTAVTNNICDLEDTKNEDTWKQGQIQQSNQRKVTK